MHTNPTDNSRKILNSLLIGDLLGAIDHFSSLGEPGGFFFGFGFRKCVCNHRKNQEATYMDDIH